MRRCAFDHTYICEGIFVLPHVLQFLISASRVNVLILFGRRKGVAELNTSLTFLCRTV